MIQSLVLNPKILNDLSLFEQEEFKVSLSWLLRDIAKEPGALSIKDESVFDDYLRILTMNMLSNDLDVSIDTKAYLQGALVEMQKIYTSSRCVKSSYPVSSIESNDLFEFSRAAQATLYVGNECESDGSNKFDGQVPRSIWFEQFRGLPSIPREINLNKSLTLESFKNRLAPCLRYAKRLKIYDKYLVDNFDRFWSEGFQWFLRLWVKETDRANVTRESIEICILMDRNLPEGPIWERITKPITAETECTTVLLGVPATAGAWRGRYVILPYGKLHLGKGLDFMTRSGHLREAEWNWSWRANDPMVGIKPCELHRSRY